MPPILIIPRTFDTVINIGEDKHLELPIHVRRLPRDEMDVFRSEWDRLMEPIGSATPTADEVKTRESERAAFYEQWIIAAITLDAGLVKDGDDDVVDGAGMMALFHHRFDVLNALLIQIFTLNHLSTVLRKNSLSPRASASGSEASTPARGGDAQGSTAPPVDGSTTAAPAAATAEPPAASSGAREPVH